MTTQFLPGGLFDSFPEPVLLLAEGQVAYRNPAAADLFPESAPGGAAPEELARLLAGAQPPAVVSGDLGGRSWTVSLQDPGQGLLAVLRPLAFDTGPDLGRLTAQLRRETAGLAAALQRLAWRASAGSWDSSWSPCAGRRSAASPMSRRWGAC